MILVLFFQLWISYHYNYYIDHVVFNAYTQQIDDKHEYILIPIKSVNFLPVKV